MDCNFIRAKSSEAVIECDTKSFPLDCFQILDHYGYKIYSYSELRRKNKELYDMCVEYSEDAFHSGSSMIIAYNDEKPRTRIRFSLMHELGHHVLGHKSDSPENETEANYFASNILAPRIAMYYAKCKTIREVAQQFEISSSAAYYAAQDFSEWCNDVCKNGMHIYDKNLYRQFYNKEYDGFVYSIKKCEFCGAKVYNTIESLCRSGCKLPDDSDEYEPKIYFRPLSEDDRRLLSRLENNWLYNF